jgi:hypothetical protein
VEIAVGAVGVRVAIMLHVPVPCPLFNWRDALAYFVLSLAASTSGSKLRRLSSALSLMSASFTRQAIG